MADAGARRAPADRGSVANGAGARAPAFAVRRECAPTGALAELEAELARVADERDALRRIADDRAAALENLDRVKEELLAAAGHDLKSPLTSIVAHVELLLRSVDRPGADVGRIASGLAVIRAQALTMARLVDDLLDASRIQAGALVPRVAPCDLGACLVTVLGRLSPEECDLGACLVTVLGRLSPEEWARVTFAPIDSPLVGRWEQQRIEQVLANLIGNALKYSPAGEPVSIAVERRFGETEVAVADRGIGIPAAELPRLFARFYRTPQVHAGGLAGSGLGLYIACGIIVAHGGRLWAESPGEGLGTTFRFILPDRRPA